LDLHHLRRQIGVVSGRAPRFDGSLIENLTLFQGDELAVDHAELLTALGIDDSVAMLAEGYATQVTAAGGGASEDLMQRVGIARVLLQKPKLIILDDVSDSLDQTGDRYLINTLRQLRGRLTLILISQRPSLLKVADRLLELRNGRLEPLQVERKARGQSPARRTPPNPRTPT
jgi:ATP-binding cassette subfamily C protein LapB